MTKQKSKDLLPFSSKDLEGIIGKELYVCAYSKNFIDRMKKRISHAISYGVKKHDIDAEAIEPSPVGIVGEIVAGPPGMLTYYHLGDARAIGHKKGNRIAYTPPADLENYIMTLKSVSFPPYIPAVLEGTGVIYNINSNLRGCLAVPMVVHMNALPPFKKK
ncbi:MAG: hypothetical protein HY363_06325 [Candidatus Aenigmarchaeota archaeon]|nr:hypothetical protein [Candidatus Aenigmarchaeota archaeon]